MTLRELSESIMCCRKCRLWETAKCAVPGEGSSNAQVVLVGQNPGAEEDKVGRPFVGRAGKFLDTVLLANGIDRAEIFVTSIVKHATPQNRVPLADEIVACLPYLIAQIEALQPKIVVLMGRIATQTPRRQSTLFIETVHPAAAMRFPKMQKRFEKDFGDLSSCISHLKYASQMLSRQRDS